LRVRGKDRGLEETRKKKQETRKRQETRNKKKQDTGKKMSLPDQG
jgi:hypothetical protein